jgi:hypothetical protein
MEIDEATEVPTVVHNYAVAGGDLKEHIAYLYYLVNSFDIVYITIDNAGFQFIDSATESELFKRAGISFDFIDFDSDLIGQDYEVMLKTARQQYSKNKIGGRIVTKQVFSSDFIRNANVLLQTSIDHKKVWFGSRINPNGSALSTQSSAKIPMDLLKEESIIDLIDTQDRLINDVKKQCALIEVKSTAKGTQSFDLPLHLKRSTSVDRARKDNYTALLLGNWANKCYFDIMRQPKDTSTGMFVPMMI